VPASLAFNPLGFLLCEMSEPRPQLSDSVRMMVAFQCRAKALQRRAMDGVIGLRLARDLKLEVFGDLRFDAYQQRGLRGVGLGETFSATLREVGERLHGRCGHR
jgi:hypothetical protein